MNIHLAKLHIRSFIRSVCGVDVKVFPNALVARHSSFAVFWKFTCAVALAHVTRAHDIFRFAHGTIFSTVGFASMDHVAYLI